MRHYYGSGYYSSSVRYFQGAQGESRGNKIGGERVNNSLNFVGRIPIQYTS
jgi:hypothetical protein